MVLVPFRLVYLLKFVVIDVFVLGAGGIVEEVDGCVSKMVYFLLLLLGGSIVVPIYVSISAMARIFVVTVHVVPDGSDTNQYNIWYYVNHQIEEYKKANPLPESADKKEPVRESGDGVELKTVNSSTAMVRKASRTC